MIGFLSIVVLTFALALVLVGALTTWLERGRRKVLGIVLTLVGVTVGTTYALLGSRLSERLFGRLVIAVDLPALMATAFTYTAGVLIGGSLAAGLFLWATGRFRHQLARTTLVLVGTGVLVAAAATMTAVILSTH